MYRYWDATKKILYIRDGATAYPIGGGGVIASVSVKTADYTVTNADYCIVIDATSNTVTIQLPAAPETGRVVNVACLNSTYLADIAFNGKNFYASSANEALIAGENLTVMYDGTRWVGA